MATDKLVDFDHVTDYISREAAISEIMSEPTDAHYPSWYAEKLKQVFAADVRPVVRCKDCKYWCSTLTYIDLLEARHDPYTDGVCDLYDCDGFQPNDFCSKAVRRDNYGADMRESNLDTTKGDNHD